MNENPDLEQNYYTKRATDNCKIGHDCIRLMKWLANYDRSYHENMNYYDLMASALN